MLSVLIICKIFSTNLTWQERKLRYKEAELQANREVRIGPGFSPAALKEILEVLSKCVLPDKIMAGLYLSNEMKRRLVTRFGQ